MNTDVFKTLGKMCYKYLSEKDESLELLRIVGITSSDIVKVKILESEDKNNIGKINKVSYNKLHEEYTFLEPSGIIIFSDVNVGTHNNENGSIRNVSDVIVAEYRTIDINSGNYEPWVVCRQNITDLFSQLLVQENPEEALVGMSTTKASLPAGIDYKIMMACESVNKTIVVNMYLKDTLKDILDIIKVSYFDKILESNCIDHIRYVESKINRKLKLKKGVKSVDGYCLTLEQLLKENNFWYDVEQGFDIVSINKDIETDESGESLSEQFRYELSTILRKAIASTIVIKYDMDIDLDEFKNNEYILLRVPNNDLYVIGFTTIGEYIDPDMQNEEIKKEIENIMNCIVMDKSKYTI